MIKKILIWYITPPQWETESFTLLGHKTIFCELMDILFPIIWWIFRYGLKLSIPFIIIGWIIGLCNGELG